MSLALPVPAFGIAALGEAMIEFNEEPDGRYVQGFGGDTSNAAIAAARLGARVRYLTLVGADRFGDMLMALWLRESIDTEYVGRHATAPTGVYVVNHGAAGHAFTYLRAGSAASHMSPTDIPLAAFDGIRLLHLSAVSQAISASAHAAADQAIAMAKAAGVTVSYDTNLRLRLWDIDRARTVSAATAAQADIVKTSIEDGRLLTGLDTASDIARHYQALGPRLVVVTLGRDGALVATPERQAVIAGVAVTAADATGAGDAFAGAMLARLAAGDDPFAAARYANVAAALATTGYGAVAPLPTHAEVEKFLMLHAPGET